VVVAKADLFGEEWLGRKIDSVFLSYLNELRQRHNIQLCGEAGEYHTFVTDGPLFNQIIEILETDKILREGYRFLGVTKYALRVK
jgi:diphthamide synthase (EF-2-diphthine--ammonia ligase)